MGFCNSVKAQKGLELGFGVGTSHFFGDVNSSFKIKHFGLSAGIIGRYNFNERVCLKFSGNWANINGSDEDSKNTFEKARNLSFKSMLIDGAGQFEFNFLPYIHGSKDQFLTPYIFMGFGVVNFNPKAFYNNSWVELRDLGTEGQFRGEEYYSTVGTFVYGGGLKMDINYEWSLNLELGMRYAFTDYLDDVSTVYADKQDLESLRGALAVELSDRSIEKIGIPGFQRGTSKGNDSYGILQLGIVYYFGNIRCPDF
ncbi:MAG: outer membrane beta-barrel protein [Saprospiraceae bacterium]|nr:outer membrane beta-barrel protein [Saprospiraceae bacterium]